MKNETYKDNLKRIADQINDTCSRVNRDPKEITLIAVTKNVEVDTISDFLEIGHTDFGESRPQELVKRNAFIAESINHDRKMAGLNPDQVTYLPRWHMIGHLQRNKVRQILPFVGYIHSVDSLRLAEEINTSAARLGLEHKVRIFMQVNTSEEKQKTGLAVGAVIPLADQICTLPNLEIVGLMTMAPHTDDLQKCSFCFGRLREIFEEIKGENIIGPSFQHLSMGMSQDYIAAIEKGATMLRIGSAIFNNPNGQL
ncbi:MAG: YggS family pyridoxal phosphate-dependent enzyme [Phycisphaerae bacterium]|nr:YggS family pyridoxal phosphate-dependent enzyme [Phycisphaerae bacterium]